MSATCLRDLHAPARRGTALTSVVADPDHEACADLLISATEDLMVPTLVLAELDHWCRPATRHRRRHIITLTE